MLIRNPVADVFNAFVDPGTITKFWLESATGPLVKGARVVWRFMVPGAEETVIVTALEDQQRIAFDWSNGMGVTLTFAKKGDRATRVAVEVTGFHGSEAEDQVVTTTEGFSIVLCDLKTLLETGHSANLVKDKAELIAQSL